MEYNLDPLRIGRCKVRVHNLHSTEKSIETKDLPWAKPMPWYGGVHDCGSMIVPAVGSTTFVLFGQGDPEHPVYFGSWYKNPTELRDINFKTSKETGEVLPTVPVSAGQWQQPIGPEVPSEFSASPYFDPTVKVLLKSLKGHTFLAEDRDGFESLSIIDRAGQELVFKSPVTDNENDFNSAQRGLKEARVGTDLDYDKLAGSTSTVELLGKNGQGFRITASPDSESVEVTSKDATYPAASDQGANKVTLRLGAGLGIIELIGVSEGQETFRLLVHTSTGNVELKSTGSFTLSSDLIALLGKYIQVQGDVSVRGNLSVVGDISSSGRVSGS